MRIVECKDEKSWVDEINSWLAHEIETHRAKRIFIPAGETPRPLYRSWQNIDVVTKPLVVKLLNQATFVQLDEILNQDRPFRQFFQETLPSFCNKIEFIESAENGADIALLGLGLNGHVAFHEPGLSDNLYSGCIELSAETAKRLRIAAPARGVTYGLGAFLKAKSVGLLVRGESKAEILTQILKAECQLPAAKLKRHKNLTIFTDFKV